jgi:xylulokinase
MKPLGYLGLDVGGTGAKAGVVDGQGHLLKVAHRPFQPLLTPEGHVEIPIESIYTAAREATVTAIRESGAQIVALGISSQGQTFVSLNERDEPLHRAIVWYDARAGEQAKRLQQALEDADLHEPMPELNPIATVPKIMWLHEHYPAVMVQARRFLLLPDYFAYRLTGRAVTDPCTASSTGVYAEDAPDYCAAALAAAGITKAQMAEIQLPGQPIGRVLPKLAGEWGLTPEALLVAGTNDQYAGALGAGNCRPGIVSVTTGTSLALVTLTEHLPDPLPTGLWGGRFPIARYQFALAFAKTAGVVLEWFNRELSPKESLRELDQLAASVPVGSRGVVALPHFDGMISPVPDVGARGAFLNLALHHTRADLYHAILESLGFSFRENVELLQRGGFHSEVMRAIGGGAKSDCLMQMNADITGFPIERPQVTEAAVLGAAMIAAVGAGASATLEECSAAFYRRERVFLPEPRNHALYEELYHRYVELYRHVYRHPQTPGAG